MVQQVGYGEIVASDDWYIQSSHKPLRKDPSLRWVFFIETWLSDSKSSLRLVIYGGKMDIFAFLKVYKGKTGCFYALKLLIMSHTPLESRKWCFDFFQNLGISMCTVEMFFFSFGNYFQNYTKTPATTITAMANLWGDRGEGSGQTTANLWGNKGGTAVDTTMKFRYLVPWQMPQKLH